MMKSATAKSEVSVGSKLTEQKRARLEEIQKREQLKGMLISKFLKKYGKNKDLQTFIDA
jgi:hypothetical protein